MNVPTTEELEARIRASIEKVKGRGISIEPDYWNVGYSRLHGEWTHNGRSHCCPLGAVLLDVQPVVSLLRRGHDPDHVEVIADYFGVDTDWVELFIAGFDGHLLEEKHTPEKPLADALLLGRKFRSEIVGDDDIDYGEVDAQ